MYEVCGEKELKVLLALNPGDSISGVARKIDENRETIRRVVNRLEEAGYVSYDDGLQLVDQSLRDIGLEFLTTAADISPPSISEAYVLPQFAGMEYAYTAIDAVYVWTRGGYQVARDPTDYPLFIAVHESELTAWTEFFDRFGIPTAQERQATAEFDGAIQVVLEARPQVEFELVDGRPVVPLQETVDFAYDHYATFESALDMLDRMYDDVVAFLEERGFERKADHEVPSEETIYNREIEIFERTEGLPHPVGVDLLVNGLGCRQTSAEWSFEYLREHSTNTTISGGTRATTARTATGELLVAAKLHSGRKTDFADILAAVPAIDLDEVESHLHRGDADALQSQLSDAQAFIEEGGLDHRFKSMFGQSSVSAAAIDELLEFLKQQQ